MIRTAQAVGFKLGEMSELMAAKQHQAPVTSDNVFMDCLIR
jgi:hypothetical protein